MDPEGPAADLVPEWASFWPVDAYRRFGELVRAELARRGIAATFDHLHCGVVHVGGSTLGMTNLARRCRDAPDDAWPAIVRDHVAAVTDATPTDVDALRAAVKLRVYPEHVTRSATAMTCRPLARDLVVALALDLPARVESLSPATKDRLGLPDDALFALGEANLRAEPRLTPLDDPPDGVQLLHGDSYFAASHLLRLADYLDDPDAPALIAVPHRHLLVIGALDHRVHAVIGAVIAIAHHAHASEEGPVAPHPYVYQRGALTRVMSGVRDDGQPWCAPPPELLAILEALPACSPA